MSKIDHNKIRKNGIVIRQLVGNYWRVELDNGIKIMANVASKFRVARREGKGTKRPRIFEADKVILEIPLGQTKLERGTIVDFQKNN